MIKLFFSIYLPMKNILSSIAFICLSSYAAAADLYKIDNNHAAIIWQTSHFGFSAPSGKFTDVNGTITIDHKNPRNSLVDITIKTASIFTGLAKFDQHLKSSDFFHVAKFPTATFVSKSVTPTGMKTANIRGELTLLGVTKMVTLKTKLNKLGKSPITQKKTAGFSASTTIKRSDYNMHFGLPGISDKVKINIEIEAGFISSDAHNNKNATGHNKLFKTPSEPKIPSWKIVPTKSTLEFKAMQKDSPIRGFFTRFNGDIHFNKNALSKSNVKIEIDTTSIETSFSGALEAAKSQKWLSVNKFSRATFEAKNFTARAKKNTFRADGTLTIKGKKIRTSIDFLLEEYSKTKAIAIGKTTIKRSHFKIGDRNPRKANDIANDVEITFRIEAER